MTELANYTAQLVPAGYAEKAMASLMQLHSELMDEKERRVDLYRRLMEREQALAELKMYVKLLEEKMTPAAGPVSAPGAHVAPPTPPVPPRTQAARVPPQPPRVATPGARVRPEDWKSW